MEATQETTKHFVNKTGDKLLIEIEITGNPDDVIKDLVISLNQNKNIFDGAKINQIYFKNTLIDKVLKDRYISALTDNLNKIINELNDI